MIDGSIRMVVPPVEPEVLDRWQGGEARPRRGTAHRTALEVPLTRCAGNHQDHILGSALAEKLDVLVFQATHERAHRFPIRSAQYQDRLSSHAVLDRTLLENRIHRVAFALARKFNPH